MDATLFTCPLSFMGVPYSHDLAGAHVAVIGLPFDVGTDPYRIGSRHGPRAIRTQSGRIRRYSPPHADIDVLAALGVVDCGDVRLVPSYLKAAHVNIEEAVSQVLSAGAIPFTMGGDGTVTLPQLRAHARRHPGLVVLHIDSHTDAMPGDGRAAATGTTFMRAAEERLIDPAASMHIGVRGPYGGKRVYEQANQLGYTTVSFAALRTRGSAEVIAEVQERMRSRPVYVCWDMDFFDPAFAPGVCAPTPGGASAAEGLEIIKGLADLDIVAIDVNTVSPPHDAGGVTALLAAQVLYEFMVLAWLRMSGKSPS